MGFSSFFHVFVYFSILTGANCTPGGCSCACRPPSPPPQPCAPLPVMPIMLDNFGPNPCPLQPINAPPVQTTLISKPPIPLPACLPPPKTVANTCHCIKTVVKPQVVQQLITVPSIQRYIQTTHTPVVENIHYQGIPINCPPYASESGAAPAPAPAPVAAALTLAKPPALATIPPNLLALLSLLARQPPAATACAPAVPACAPAVPACAPAAPACAPPAPALPPCLPCLPPAAPAPSAVISLPPCLLALLSKLL